MGEPVAGRPGGGAGDVSLPSLPYVLGWAFGWGIVGCLVAAAVVVATGVDLAPALRSSVLFAEVVGFSVLTSTRLVFPLLGRFPTILRLVLQTLTLAAGALAGSLAVIAFQPLFILARLQVAVLIVATNTLVAIGAGTALHTYDRMRRQLEESYATLRRKEALERELSIARDVQQGLLPSDPPPFEGLELQGICIPAIGVGGDYFDYLPLDDQTLGLVVADVSGKGVPASLLMASLQASVRSLAMPGVTPDGLAARVNNMLHLSSSTSRYATMFFACYDHSERRLCYANAGHLPPIVIGKHGVRKLSDRSFPIGLFGDTTYESSSLTLEPGDLLAMFTDGVQEAPGENDEEYGLDRLTDFLKARRDQPLDDVAAQMLEELRQWSGSRISHDDVTLVLARAR